MLDIIFTNDTNSLKGKRLFLSLQGHHDYWIRSLGGDLAEVYRAIYTNRAAPVLEKGDFVTYPIEGRISCVTLEEITVATRGGAVTVPGDTRFIRTGLSALEEVGGVYVVDIYNDVVSYFASKTGAYHKEPYMAFMTHIMTALTTEAGESATTQHP